MNIDKILTNRFLRFAIPGLLVILFWLFLKDKISNADQLVNKRQCEETIAIKNEIIKGVLTNKYFNYRKLRHIKIFNGNDTIENDLFILERSHFYDYLEVGDSLEKKEGSLQLFLSRDGKDTTHILYFGCDGL